MSTFEIKSRWSGTVQFACELDASFDDASFSLRLGAAVMIGYERDANLTGADLTNANLTGADLTNADLTNANLTGADLTNANLTNANLTGANLTGADLTNADLTNANLIGANLYGANLTNANLTGANLIGANLRGADLRGADLRGADLRGADLYGAKYGEGVPLTREPIFISGLRYPVHIFDEHIKIGCEIHRVSEWESYSDREIIEMDGREAARDWRTHKAWIIELARKHQALCSGDSGAE